MGSGSGSGNVTVVGDWADAYDAQVRWDANSLDGWVEESGFSVTSMVIASTAGALMTFSQSFVDMGRFGNGVLVEGGWRGVGKDALRALSIVGTGGAIAGRLGKLLQVAQTGNTCVWQAAANSLRWTGQRFLATAEDLARAAGLEVSSLEGLARAAQITKIQEALTKLGVTFRVLSAGEKTVEGAVGLATSSANGVVNFSLRWATAGGSAGHRFYVSFTRAAGLMIKDPNFPQKVIRTVAQLKDHLRVVYGAKDVVLSDSPILFIQDAMLVTISQAAQRATEFAQLVLPLAPLIPVSAPNLGVARKAVELTSANLSGDRSGAMASHTVAPGETLGGIAAKYYGDGRNWPLIYGANAQTIGASPNRIRPGTVLRIPNARH